MYMEIGLLILSIALLLLVLFSLPILWKIWRAVNDVTVTLDALNQHLPGILKNLEDITTNINNSTEALNNEIEKYSAAASRFHKAIDNIVNVIEFISPFTAKSPIFQKVTQAIAVAKGIRVFLSVLREKEKVNKE
jgi:uncharacterized protein YoxC